jgi:hypothetical protein
MNIQNFLPNFVRQTPLPSQEELCPAGYYCQSPKLDLPKLSTNSPVVPEIKTSSFLDTIPLISQVAATLIPNKEFSLSKISLPSLRNMLPSLPSIPRAISFTVHHTWNLWKILPKPLQLTTAMVAGILCLKAWEKIKGFKATVHNTNTNTNKNEVTINVTPRETASNGAPVTVTKDGKGSTVIAIHC